ncbi:mCG113877, isoform CRA_a [Mus musculus]|nr:mCG113877, isoform CRA_a [Mus musculus]
MGNCCDTRVLPQECTNTPFSTDDRPRTKSSLTVGSRKRRNIFTIVRNIHHKNPVVPMEAEEHQAPTSSSIQKPQNETKVVAECSDGAALPVDKGKGPVKMAEATSKKRRCVVPENADSAPSARGQKEPPVGMVKEETKKRRHSMYYRIS